MWGFEQKTSNSEDKRNEEAAVMDMVTKSETGFG